MRGVAIVAVLLGLAACESAAGSTPATANPRTGVESIALAPGLRESTVTRIGPVQQAYGVGSVNILIANPPICSLESESQAGMFGALIGSSHAVWVVWDVAALPPDAEVIRVEIEHQLTPNG